MDHEDLTGVASVGARASAAILSEAYLQDTNLRFPPCAALQRQSAPSALSNTKHAHAMQVLQEIRLRMVSFAACCLSVISSQAALQGCRNGSECTFLMQINHAKLSGAHGLAEEAGLAGSHACDMCALARTSQVSEA